MKKTCDWCGSECDGYTDKIKNIYGDYLCKNCWNSYRKSPEFGAECFMNITAGRDVMSNYSEKELEFFIKAFKKYYRPLLRIAAPDRLINIEASARQFGLFV